MNKYIVVYSCNYSYVPESSSKFPGKFDFDNYEYKLFNTKKEMIRFYKNVKAGFTWRWNILLHPSYYLFIGKKKLKNFEKF